MTEMLTRISDALFRGEHEEVSDLTRAAADDLDPQQILDDGLIAGMDRVGELFKAHEIFLPEVLMAARAMQAGTAVLEPLLASGGGALSRGRVVIGTVRGDLHDIGKSLVTVMLRGAGFDVADLGNDVAPERFVDEAVEKEASVIGMSALLTTTMPAMGEVVELVRSRGLEVATIVGGAPVSKEFAREIGADGYGFDAANAVDLVKSLTAGT